MCFSDISCYSLLYQQQVAHTRTDITIVPFTYDVRQHYLDSLADIQRFHYTTGPYYDADIISWNMYKGRDVYVADVSNSYVTYIGLDGQAFYLIPNGYVDRVSKDIPSSPVQDATYQATRNYHAYFENSLGGTKSKNYWDINLLEYLTKPISINSYLYWEEGYLHQAVSTITIENGLNKDYEASNRLSQSIQNYETQKVPYHGGETILTSDQMYNMGVGYLKQPNKSEAAYLYLLWSTFENPLNVQARLTLAELYVDSGIESFKQLGKIELQNVLKLDPSNQEAAKDLTILRQKGID